MVFPFGKKEEKTAAAPRPIPVNEIRALAARGLTEQAIAADLLSRGYSREEILQGFREVLRGEVTGAPSNVEVARHPPAPAQPPAQPQSQFQGPSPELGQERLASPTLELTSRAPAAPAPLPPVPTQTAPPKPALPRPEFQLQTSEFETPAVQRVRESPEKFGRPVEEIVTVEKPPMQLPSAPGFAPKAEKQEYTFEEKPEEVAPTPEVPSISPTEITLEEVIEGIIAEKFTFLEERFSDFDKKDLQLEQEIEGLRARIEELELALKEREKTLDEKFDNTMAKMEAIEGKLGATQKIFSETLPELTSKVRMINESIEQIKKATPKREEEEEY